MAWTSIGASLGYKQSYYVNYNGPVTLPANITKVMVEVWSAGAGGSDESGGCSGSYARLTKEIAAGSTINLTIGNGGLGKSGATAATDGGNTTVTFSDASYITVNGAFASVGTGWKGYTGNYYSNRYVFTR
jgi:hypothetical protein